MAKMLASKLLFIWLIFLTLLIDKSTEGEVNEETKEILKRLEERIKNLEAELAQERAKR